MGLDRTGPDRNDTALRLENVTVRHGTDSGEKAGRRASLDDISLEIGVGQFLAVVGANGSGKSTLAKVIAGLCSVSSGKVVRGLPPARLLMQHPDMQIVGETVFEDLCFGMENMAVDPGEMPKRALSALETVGMPGKLHTPVDQLSGGEKQLLLVAGCLAAEAEFIVFDEATSMLDPSSRRLVLHAVRRLHRLGKTIVWITHFLEETALADKMAVLCEGRLVYTGEKREFFYGNSQEPSLCERLGFHPPYAVRFARKWMELGGTMPFFPVSAEELFGFFSGGVMAP